MRCRCGNQAKDSKFKALGWHRFGSHSGKVIELCPKCSTEFQQLSSQIADLCGDWHVQISVAKNWIYQAPENQQQEEMPLITFSVDTDKHEEHPEAWEYVYFHGQLEQEQGFDLVRSNTKKADICDGKHHGLVQKKPVTVFLWSTKHRRLGLIVLDSDEEAMQFALHKFTQKTTFV